VGIDFPESQEDANIIGNNPGPQQQKQEWSQQLPNYQGKYLDNYYNYFYPNQPSLQDLILEQSKLMRVFLKSLLLMIRF
jgi:hypothetical protein